MSVAKQTPFLLQGKLTLLNLISKSLTLRYLVIFKISSQRSLRALRSYFQTIKILKIKHLPIKLESVSLP